jgi:hypothetical protein
MNWYDEVVPDPYRTASQDAYQDPRVRSQQFRQQSKKEACDELLGGWAFPWLAPPQEATLKEIVVKEVEKATPPREPKLPRATVLAIRAALHLAAKVLVDTADATGDDKAAAKAAKKVLRQEATGGVGGLEKIEPGTVEPTHTAASLKGSAAPDVPPGSFDVRRFDGDGRPVSKVGFQGKTDLCAAFALAAVSEEQEGEALDPSWCFAHIKKAHVARGAGTEHSWGATTSDAAVAAVEDGFLPAARAPFTWRDRGRNFVSYVRNYERLRNYGTLRAIAAQNRKRLSVPVDEGDAMDLFDTLVRTLYKLRSEHRAILTGVKWRPGWDRAAGGVIPPGPYAGSGGYGHALKACGYKVMDRTEYLVVQNSFGAGVGDGGLFYMPRDVVNENFKYGSYMFVDIPEEEEEKLAAPPPPPPRGGFFPW